MDNVSAVHDEGMAEDIGGILGNEERDRASDLLVLRKQWIPHYSKAFEV